MSHAHRASRREFLARATVLSAAALSGCRSSRRTTVHTNASGQPADDYWSATRIEQRTSGARLWQAEHRVSRPAGDARPAIQAALNAAAMDGGGTVRLEPGDWRCDGPLQLRSATTLHLDHGARLTFTPDPALYLPLVLTRWEGTDCWNYSPLLYALHAHDVAITGAGVIDGRAGDVFGPWRDRQAPAQQRLRAMGADATPVAQRVFGAGHFLRPDFLQLLGCDGVTISGVTFVDSPFWVIHPTYCRNVRVSGVTVRSPRLNNDGVDPDSCTDVVIDRCTFETGDDAVAIKSGRDADGWRVARPTMGVVIRDCRMPQAHNGIAIGSEMSGSVRHVHIADCVMGKVGSALYFKANLDRGGTVGDITVQNVEVTSAETLLHFTTAYHSYRGGNAVPTFRDFSIRDVRCTQAEIGLAAIGAPTAPLQRVHIDGLHITSAKTPAHIQHVRGLRLSDVVVNGAPVRSAADVDT